MCYGHSFVGLLLAVCCVVWLTVQAFPNAGLIQTSSVCCKLGYIRAAILLLISVLVDKAEGSDFFFLSLVNMLGA